MHTRLYRGWFVVSFVVIVSLLLGYFSYYVNPSRELVRDDGVKKWEESMQPVREYLPSLLREYW